MSFCSNLQAQEKKYVYIDSTLLYPPDESISNDSINAPITSEEATSDASTQNVIEIDTTVYYTHFPISKDTVNAWKKNKNFAYVQYLDSLLKAEKLKQKKQEEDNIQSSSTSSWLDRLFASKGLQIFLWVIAGSFIVFILYNLFLADGVFRRSSKKADTSLPIVEEELINHESDFDAMIRIAVQSGNYRLAIRYHYLQTLHLLAVKNQIQLAADKTNYQYVKELSNKNYQNDFAAITLNYEYVWYGEFSIDESVYGKLKNALMSFNNKF